MILYLYLSVGRDGIIIYGPLHDDMCVEPPPLRLHDQGYQIAGSIRTCNIHVIVTGYRRNMAGIKICPWRKPS